MQRFAPVLIIVVSSLAIGGLAWYGPIAQDPAYHDFADQRTLFAVPNFWNVVSNLPFALVGIMGLSRCAALQKDPLFAENRQSYILFFTPVLLIGFGSGYYHLQPDNWRLAGDRLAMALSFMTFLAIVIGEFVSNRLGRQLLLPLGLFGLLSVGYWIVTEQLGAGDLRPYAITQFLPMLVIMVIIFSWKSESIKTSDILIIGAGYGLAKVFEFLDAEIYQVLMISGHTLKHLAAAFSAYWLLIILNRRAGTLP
ncbi:MAG: ceramidase domain-containing protein [Desulfobulbaceae bacterium]|nr:ceramidase domain-containing protein [Desulfobulbaceae bacterium]